MAFRSLGPAAEITVPDGSPIEAALARTTDLGIVAHPDDLEFMAVAAIAACRDEPARWFTGVTCTDGAGSARSGDFAGLTDDDMIAVRRQEQRAAADIGRYGAIVQLGYPSAAIRAGGDAAARPAAGRERGSERPAGLVAALAEVLVATRPVNVYTHNLADKHPTHLAAVVAAIEAIRSLPADQRPSRVVGIEGWRGLDWLDDRERLLIDVSEHAALARELAAVFVSQIAGGKRYDLAEEGRRRANATLLDPHAVDEAEQLTLAMDLTPLVHDDDLDPAGFVASAIDRFRDDVTSAIRAFST
ncbi:MAG: PIG-L deacetylase family protein [Acidimicrobiales bacterium]